MANKIPTNEEVIEKLVEGLEESCKVTEEEKHAEKEAVEEAIGGNNSQIEEESNTRADDYIDELELKDKELNYTDEDRQRLREESDKLRMKGNELFKTKEYKESAECYTLALRTCPLVFTKERAVLYANRSAAKIKLELSESALEDCTKAVDLDPEYLKALVRRAQLHEQLDKLDEALEDYKKVLLLDSDHKEASFAVRRLPEQIAERNERLKTEMLGKLKDLGNVFLKPFGLSTNNFSMVQDENTGGYSFSFKQS